jgi:hypothetical protein
VSVTRRRFRIAQKKISALSEEDVRFRGEVGELDSLPGVVVA